MSHRARVALLAGGCTLGLTSSFWVGAAIALIAIVIVVIWHRVEEARRVADDRAELAELRAERAARSVRFDPETGEEVAA